MDLQITYLEEDMRIIINDELLFDQGYLALTKAETDNLFRIVSTFSRYNSDELEYSYIKNILSLDENFFNKVSFCLKVENGKIIITKYFNWFKNNKENVKACRNKVPGTAIVKKTTSQEEKVDNIDYERIKNIFNNAFAGTKIASIKILSDKRKQSIRILYYKMIKQMETKVDIYEFYETYFTMIKNDKKRNLTNGWLNTASNTWFLPTLDFYLKEKCFIGLVENN